MGSLTGSAGPFQVENCFFQIADKKNNLTSFYVYSAEGVGKGLIRGLNLAATMKGPWNDFKTNSPIRVSQFDGAARFTTGGVGQWTSNHLNLMGLPEAVSTVRRVLDITTGFTIGIGGSTSVGDMILNPREELIYKATEGRVLRQSRARQMFPAFCKLSSGCVKCLPHHKRWVIRHNQCSHAQRTRKRQLAGLESN